MQVTLLVSISLFYAKGKSANLLTCLPQASNVLSNSLSEFGGQVFRADSPLFEGVSVAHRHGAILDGLTIDGDAKRCSRLVLSTIASSHRRFLVVENGHVRLEQLLDFAGLGDDFKDEEEEDPKGGKGAPAPAAAQPPAGTRAGFIQQPGLRVVRADPINDDFAHLDHAADEEEILLIAVLPEHRGQGFGQELIEQLFSQSQARGVTKVFLEMRRGNPAEYLYRKSGFEPIGMRRDYSRLVDGGRVDAITFGRSI